MYYSLYQCRNNNNNNNINNNNNNDDDDDDDNNTRNVAQSALQSKIQYNKTTANKQIKKFFFF